MASKYSLIIVESPTKAVTIGKFLGKEYRVESSYGHVRDLPRSRFGIDIEHEFTPQYIIPVKARKRVTELKKIASKAQAIILASDEDREGEAIAWHVQGVLSEPSKKEPGINPIEGKPVSRIVFHEITKDAIEHAIAHPRELDINMVNAQQARRILDRLVGYKLSPFLWKKIAKGLSAGRVQSVALRLIVDRENEIRAFKPEEFWSIAALLKKAGASDALVSADLIRLNDKALEKFDIKDAAYAQKLAADLKSAAYSVASVKKTETKKNPLPPFTTSTLQQTASSRLGYSAKKTMMFAQMLYEKGLITYMRTDAVNLSKESVLAAQQWLKTELGEQYALPEPRVFTGKSKLAQEAHEAIRPTKLIRAEDIEVKEEAERKVYRLIWERFVASQMPQAVFDATSVDIAAKGATDTYTLRANGNMMKFDGYLKIYGQKVEEKEIPSLSEGEKLTVQEIKPEQHFTEPPARFTEARLIKTLEEYGIGRPSTYVPIISVIQSRNYVKKEGGSFVPTEIGEIVNKILTKNFPEIVDINFTATMEEKLDLVAAGNERWQELLQNFYTPFNANLEAKYLSVDKEFEDEKTTEVCEKCGKPMVIKFGRFGKFLACTGFPECKNAKPYGQAAPKKIGLKCPKCLTGEVVEKWTRRGRKKMFWGCDRYPDCDFASWNNPLEPEPEKKPKAPKASKKTEKEVE